MTTLREALDRALNALPANDVEAREQLTMLLRQKSDTHVTLVDECEIAIHG